tara:strand:- start:10060 stop:10242 length:183 start_codon:yes stop_codon:yes gene_type:complete
MRQQIKDSQDGFDEIEENDRRISLLEDRIAMQDNHIEWLQTVIEARNGVIKRLIEKRRMG